MMDEHCILHNRTAIGGCCDIWLFVICRYNEKVTLECELAELRWGHLLPADQSHNQTLPQSRTLHRNNKNFLHQKLHSLFRPELSLNSTIRDGSPHFIFLEKFEHTFHFLCYLSNEIGTMAEARDACSPAGLNSCCSLLLEDWSKCWTRLCNSAQNLKMQGKSHFRSLLLSLYAICFIYAILFTG